MTNSLYIALIRLFWVEETKKYMLRAFPCIQVKVETAFPGLCSDKHMDYPVEIESAEVTVCCFNVKVFWYSKWDLCWLGLWMPSMEHDIESEHCIT